MTTFELDPNSRFSIHSNPNSLPGKCCLCGSAGGDGRKFVDFGFQLDVYGAVYFCTVCVTELAQAIGFAPMDNLHAERDRAKKLHAKLLDEVKEFEEFRNAARTVLRHCSCGSGSGTVLDNVASDEDDESAGEENSSPAKSGSRKGLSDSLKSVSFDND